MKYHAFPVQGVRQMTAVPIIVEYHYGRKCSCTEDTGWLSAL